MQTLFRTFIFVPMLLQLGTAGQDQVAKAESRAQPIYRIEVIQRTVNAVNYGYRGLPTKVDMRGTALAPEAKGEAKVQSRRGVVDVEVRIKHLPAPTRFGREYLTYVLWAISPDGRPTNLGELILDADNDGKLKTSCELQSFALLVTAEPYFAVTQPSDVVVMENIIRPDTVGKVEEVAARTELLPRGHYTYLQPSGDAKPAASGEKLSMDQYEAMLALYQALNAIQIARAAGADQGAADVMRRAEQLYEEARRLQSGKGESRQVVMTARQAAQTAEDARAIQAKRAQ